MYIYIDKRINQNFIKFVPIVNRKRIGAVVLMYIIVSCAYIFTKTNKTKKKLILEVLVCLISSIITP